MLDRPQPSAAHAPAAQPSSAHAEPHIESSAVPASPPTQRPLHTAGPAEEFLPAASESATSDRQSLPHELTSPPPTVGVHSAKSSAFADQLPAHSAALASTLSAADDQQPAAGELGSQSPVAGDLPATRSGPAKQQLTGSGLDNGQRKHSLPEPQSNGLESSTHTVNPAEVHSAARDNIASHAAVPDTAIAAQVQALQGDEASPQAGARVPPGSLPETVTPVQAQMPPEQPAAEAVAAEAMADAQLAALGCPSGGAEPGGALEMPQVSEPSGSLDLLENASQSPAGKPLLSAFPGLADPAIASQAEAGAEAGTKPLSTSPSSSTLRQSASLSIPSHAATPQEAHSASPSGGSGPVGSATPRESPAEGTAPHLEHVPDLAMSPSDTALAEEQQLTALSAELDLSRPPEPAASGAALGILPSLGPQAAQAAPMDVSISSASHMAGVDAPGSAPASSAAEADAETATTSADPQPGGAPSAGLHATAAEPVLMADAAFGRLDSSRAQEAGSANATAAANRAGSFDNNVGATAGSKPLGVAASSDLERPLATASPATAAGFSTATTAGSAAAAAPTGASQAVSRAAGSSSPAAPDQLPSLLDVDQSPDAPGAACSLESSSGIQCCHV